MYRFLKRTTDIVVSATAILILAPLLVPVMLILRFTGEGEVFYRQQRVGYQNKTFDILKFATMLKDSPNMKGGEITLRRDPRVLPFGGFLRMTKINELPQLFNILKGDMSLVGPRPLMDVSFRMYTPEVQNVVYRSVPGLTGIGSLVFRDEEKLASRPGIDPRKFYREQIYPYKGQLELWYYTNRGIGTDLKILGLTAWHVAFSNSMLMWTFFSNLPTPPIELGLNRPPVSSRISA